MPDLGKYTTEVLSAYGISIAILAGLIAVIIWRSRRTLRKLEQIEARKDG